MNNKEFIAELSHRFGYTHKDATQLVASVIGEMSEQWQEGNIISIQNFGLFEVKKKMERISVNPLTKQRTLIPPKLVLGYKPSTALKDKFKQTLEK
ncbi:MAG: HU family DNA-binding protein [Phocaeicola sp.]